MPFPTGGVGEALGQLYVEKTFPPEAKKRALEMIENLRAALKERIAKLEWMSPETKVQAQKKLAAFGVKVGYPDKWRDYSKLEIDRKSYVLNALRAENFEFQRQLEKIGTAGRPHRVGHDAPDGQRVLQLGHERDCLPGRHPAAAVLLLHGG